MSFRARLTRFFILIVVIPMIAVGFLVFRLISESEQAKTDARANGVLAAASSLYRSESAAASLDARSIARDVGAKAAARATPAARLRSTIAGLADQSGLARVTLRRAGETVVEFGDPTAVAPGSATVRGRQITVVASELTASQFVHELAVPGVGLLVRQGGHVLGASPPKLAVGSLPATGSVSVQ